jgi:hypothetical protein
MERCDCVPEDAPFGAQHDVDEHRYDCYGPNPCGGCCRCLGMQARYYSTLKEDDK